MATWLLVMVGGVVLPSPTYLCSRNLAMTSPRPTSTFFERLLNQPTCTNQMAYRFPHKHSHSLFTSSFTLIRHLQLVRSHRRRAGQSLTSSPVSLGPLPLKAAITDWAGTCYARAGINEHQGKGWIECWGLEFSVRRGTGGKRRYAKRLQYDARLLVTTGTKLLSLESRRMSSKACIGTRLLEDGTLTLSRHVLVHTRRGEEAGEAGKTSCNGKFNLAAHHSALSEEISSASSFGTRSL